MPRRYSPLELSELLLLLMMIVGAVAALVAALGYRQGSELYPSLVCASIVVLASARLVTVFVLGGSPSDHELDIDDEAPREDMKLRYSALYAGLMVGFVASLYFIWFPVAAIIFGALILRFVFRMRWTSAIFAGAAIGLITSGIFTLLEVTLPGPGI